LEVIMRASVLWMGIAALTVAGCGENTATTASTTTESGGSGGATGGSGGATTAGGTAGTSNGGGGTGGNATGGTGGSATGGTGGAGGGPNPGCGDGNVESGEECDDGNNLSGDGCSAGCKIEAAPTCGDGNLDLVNDEECDDGNTAAGDGCSPACQLEPVGQLCGDGAQQAPEVCDDANLVNGDGCNPTCNLKGQTSLFAGQPGQGGTMDGTGTAARFSGIGVLAANATHVFVAEEANRRIRRVNVATALVETIAGTGNQGYIDNPTGLNAAFGSLEALATDGTTIWVADGSNHVIRAMSAAAPYGVTTAVGSGTQGYMDGIGGAVQFEGIRGLTYFKNHVYFLDPTAATLRRFDPSTAEVVTLAGAPYVTGQVDGFGTNARFISPRYMVSDGSGILFIADTNGNQIRAYNTITTEVTTFAGGGPCGYVDGDGLAALIHRPRGMASDGTSIYWVEFNAHTVRQGVVATKSVSTLAGSIAGNPCLVDCSCGMNPPMGGYAEGIGSAAQFKGPFSIVFHYPTNQLFVMDGGNFVLRSIQ
jgi:cysteine-rich repeat protein